MIILGCDIGYGDTKVVVGTENFDILKKFKFPSMIGITKKLEHVENNRIKTFDGNHYMIGEDAKHLPSENMIDLTDYKNLEYFAPLLLQYAIDSSGLGKPDMIISGLSIAQINNSGYFKQRIEKYTINDVEYVNENIRIYPQGSGAKFFLDYYGFEFPKKTQEFFGDKTFVIADIGFNTSDFVLVTDGQTNPNLFKAEEKTGVMKIASRVAKLIHEKHNRSISLSEAKQIIDSGVYKLRGQRHEYSEDIKLFKEEYLKDLIKFIESSFPSVLDKLDFIQICGGGSALFKNGTNDKFIKVPKSENEFYNAIGFYLAGIKTLK